MTAAAVTGATAATPALASTLGGSSIAPTISALSDGVHDAADAADAALAAADAATAAVADSGLDVDATISPAATAALDDAVAAIQPLDLSPALIVTSLLDDVTAATERVQAQTAALTAALDDAEEAHEAELAAAKAAEEAAAAKAAEEAAAAALAAANTPDGAKATARTLAAEQYGWGDDQFSCLESLWTKESGWDYQAYNSDGGATGIPQALPGDKMADAGDDWQTNATTQIIWGLGYISASYGTPCSAWSHSQSYNWY